MRLSVDPLVEQTMDAYGYCYNNPINLTDPTGMSPEGGWDGEPKKREITISGPLTQEQQQNLDEFNSSLKVPESHMSHTEAINMASGVTVTNKITVSDISNLVKSTDLKMSQEGLDFLLKAEGHRIKPYNDSAGYATIGVGHLIAKRKVTEQDRKDWAWFKTKQDAMDLLAKDLSQTYEPAVRKLVKVPLNQHQYDAIVSFTFNVGVGGLKKSNFLKELNKGNYNGD